MTKLTEWFPPNIKPVKIGVYKIKSNFYAAQGYSYWDGKKWGYFSHEADVAEERYKEYGISHNQDRIWRGIIK